MRICNVIKFYKVVFHYQPKQLKYININTTTLYSHLSFTVIMTMLVWWIRYVAEVKTVVGCPSLKYSLRVLENFLLYFTNSLFLCSSACLPCAPGMYADTLLTASSSFLIALAISLIVSRKVFRSVISSGILERILFRLALFLFSSWKGSSVRLLRYSRLSW